MSVAQGPGHPPVIGEQLRARDLLRRWGASHDPAERARLLGRLAETLDEAVGEIVAAHPESYPELLAGLRGQADMARLIAAGEHRDGTRQAC